MRFNYLLFDAARAGKSYNQALEINSANQCLYQGPAARNLAGVAPYLFSLENKPDFESWFLEEGWGKAWGILVASDLNFEDCLNHFRRFVHVQTEDGKRPYFRFYDPRALRLFLSSCQEEWLKEFFSHIQCFLLEDDDLRYVTEYRLQNYELKTKQISAEEFIAGRKTQSADSVILEQDKNSDLQETPANLPGEPIKDATRQVSHEVLTVKTKQIDLMQNILSEKFIKNTVPFVRNNFADWAKGKDDSYVEIAIRKVIELAVKNQIVREANWEKLIQYKLQYKFNLPLHKMLKTCLSEPYKSEEYRLEKFYLALESERVKLIPITLDSNLENL